MARLHLHLYAFLVVLCRISRVIIVSRLCIDCSCRAFPQDTTDDSDDTDSDDEAKSSDGHNNGLHKGFENMPGDYPTADDLDVLVTSKMWTKVGGGSLAESGLMPPRLIREEERAKQAIIAATQAEALAMMSGSQQLSMSLGSQSSSLDVTSDVSSPRECWDQHVAMISLSIHCSMLVML